jgi:hypothetical protein
VVRSVAAIDGWSATWQPRNGPVTTLTVQRDGLVQAVDVPPGTGVLTFRYTPPGFEAGLAASIAAAVLMAGCLVVALLIRPPAVAGLARRARGRGPRSPARQLTDFRRTARGDLLRDR